MKLIVENNEVFSPEEAAEQLDIGIATLWRWVKSGKIISFKLSGRTLFPKSEIERLKEDKGSI